jgi:hypothetical protein
LNNTDRALEKLLQVISVELWFFLVLFSLVRAEEKSP